MEPPVQQSQASPGQQPPPGQPAALLGPSAQLPSTNPDLLSALSGLPSFEGLGAVGTCSLPLSVKQEPEEQGEVGHTAQDPTPGLDPAQETLARPQRGTARSRSYSVSLNSRMPVTMDTLRSVFHLSREEAADELNMSVSSLKRCCHALGISRWPHRKLRSLQALLKHQLQEPLSNSDEQEVLIAAIKREQQAIMQDPDHELDDVVLLRRVTKYKTVYARKAATMGDKGDTKPRSRSRLRRQSSSRLDTSDPSSCDDGPDDSQRLPAVVVKLELDAPEQTRQRARSVSNPRGRRSTPRRARCSPTKVKGKQQQTSTSLTTGRPAPPQQLSVPSRDHHVPSRDQLSGPVLTMPRLPSAQQTMHVYKKQASANIHGMMAAIPRPPGGASRPPSRPKSRRQSVDILRTHSEPLGFQLPLAAVAALVSEGVRPDAATVSKGQQPRIEPAQNTWDEQRKGADMLLRAWEAANGVQPAFARGISAQHAHQISASQHKAQQQGGSGRLVKEELAPLMRSSSMTDLMHPANHFCIANLLPSAQDMLSLSSDAPPAIGGWVGAPHMLPVPLSGPDMPRNWTAGAAASEPVQRGCKSGTLRSATFMDNYLDPIDAGPAQVPAVQGAQGRRSNATTAANATAGNPRHSLDGLAFLDGPAWGPVDPDMDVCAGWLSAGRVPLGCAHPSINQSSSTRPELAATAPPGAAATLAARMGQSVQKLPQSQKDQSVISGLISKWTGNVKQGKVKKPTTGGNSGTGTRRRTTDTGAVDDQLAECTVRPSGPGSKQMQLPTDATFLAWPVTANTSTCCYTGCGASGDDDNSAFTQHHPDWQPAVDPRCSDSYALPDSSLPSWSPPVHLPGMLPAGCRAGSSSAQAELLAVPNSFALQVLVEGVNGDLVALKSGGMRPGSANTVAATIAMNAAAGTAVTARGQAVAADEAQLGSRASARQLGASLLRTQPLDAERLPKLSFMATGSSTDAMLEELTCTAKSFHMATANGDETTTADKMLISSLDHLVGTHGGVLWPSPGLLGQDCVSPLGMTGYDAAEFMLQTNVDDYDLGLGL